MRLLDKKTIAVQKSQERKLEIDEGVKLAKTVDTLRETAATEQKKLGDFRVESLRQIHSEIEPLVEQKDLLVKELFSLNERRKELLLPLDKEYEVLNFKKNQLEKEKNLLESKISNFLEEERKQKERLSDVELEEARIHDAKMISERNLSEATHANSQATETLMLARKESEKILEKADIREKETVSREMEVAAEERGIINSKEMIRKKELELNNREKALLDKYQTLERAQKRLMKIK